MAALARCMSCSEKLSFLCALKSIAMLIFFCMLAILEGYRRYMINRAACELSIRSNRLIDHKCYVSFSNTHALHTYIHKYMFTYIQTFIHTYTNAYMHSFIHTYMDQSRSVESHLISYLLFVKGKKNTPKHPVVL